MSKHNISIKETLGQMVDLAVQSVPAPMWEKKVMWKCAYCKDEASGSPDAVRHKDGCVVARARRLLQL